MIYLVLLVVVIIIASFFILYASLINDPNMFSDVVGWTVGVALPFAQWFARLPVELLTYSLTGLCILHSLVLMGLPLEWTQIMRGESFMVHLLFKYSYRKTRKRIDQIALMMLERKWVRYLVYLVDGIGKLALSFVVIIIRTLTDPAVSRLFVTGVMLPLLMAITMWAFMPSFIMPVLKALVPDGWIAKEGTGERSQQVVYVTVALSVLICGGFILMMHTAPAFAAWYAGKTPPLNFLIGVSAGIFSALVFSGIFVDGNTRQSMIQANQAGDSEPSAPDPGPAHMSALAVSLFVAMAIHLILPQLNRKQYARMWLLGLAPRGTFSAAVSSIKALVKSPVSAAKGHNG